MIRCRFCGQPNEPGTKFCTNPACGMYQWDGEDEPRPEQPSPPSGGAGENGEEERPSARIIGGRAGRRTESGAGTGAAAAVEDRPSPSAAPPPRSGSPRNGRVAVAMSLPVTELEVEPPAMVTFEVVIRNVGALVDQFALTLEGPAAQWGTIDPPAVNLYPESAPVTALISFQPPRSPDTLSGPALFVVRATSREDPSVSESVAGVLVVGAYVDVITTLVPQTSRGKKGGEHELTLSNRGNDAVRATLLASDPDKQLNFSADPAVLEVPAGGDASSRVEVLPRKRIWVGKPRTLPFMVGAQIDRSPPIRSDGRHEQLPVIPAWVVKVALMIFVPLVALVTYLLMTARIPPVVGATRTVAEDRLKNAGFDATFENVPSAEVPVGSIVSTEPPRAGRILKSTPVAARVSAGPNPVEVPDVRGLDAGVARAQLLATGLTSRAVEGENDEVGPGQVFATDPGQGDLLPPEAQVVLNVRPGGTEGSRQGIGDAGPVDPTTGFPAFYPDATESGLRLEPCLAGDPLCSVDRDAFVASPPDGMAQYWSAEIVPFNSPLNDGPITFSSALVAAFGATGEAGCAPRSCAERTYAVIEISAAEGALKPDSTYVVTHPFGTSTVTTDESGAITAEVGREEVGCISNPPEECDWNAVKESRVGPFLVWDKDTLPAPPAGYIGDRVTPHRVAGSALGTNFVKITGPDLGEGLVTDEFLVQGKVSVSSAPPPGAAGAAPSVMSVTAPPQRAGVTSNPIAVKFTNNGSGNLVVSDVQVAGTNNQDWSLVSQNCTGQTIPGGGSCDVNVAVTPSAEGPTNGTLTIASNAFGGPAVIALAGTGQAPRIEPQPTEVDFGNGATNVASAPKNITLKNAGTADLVVGEVEVAGPDPGDFVVTANGCTAKVPAGQACVVKVAFKPSTGGKRSASLSIINDAPLAGSKLEIPLAGTGQAPSAKVGPSSLVLDQNAEAPVTISNTGTSPLTINSISLLGPPDAFTVTDECGKNASLAPGRACNVKVRFVPPISGLLQCTQGSLVITTDDPKVPDQTVALVGRATIGLNCSA